MGFNTVGVCDELNQQLADVQGALASKPCDVVALRWSWRAVALAFFSFPQNANNSQPGRALSGSTGFNLYRPTLLLLHQRVTPPVSPARVCTALFDARESGEQRWGEDRRGLFLRLKR